MLTLGRIRKKRQMKKVVVCRRGSDVRKKVIVCRTGSDVRKSKENSRKLFCKFCINESSIRRKSRQEVGTGGNINGEGLGWVRL
jgi:hypothetical protein